MAEDRVVPPGAGVALTLMDEARRRRGRLMDRLGLGPDEAPWTAALEMPGLRLRCYGGRGAPVLIVPAPIKRGYIWDLQPATSVVRRLLEGGHRVYLTEWLPAGQAERGFGLDDYAGRLPLAAADAVARETGTDRLVLAGHSLGGTLAALFASQQPGRVRGLVLVESPLRFGEAAGAFAPLVTAAPPLAAGPDSPPVPGSLLNLVSLTAAPEEFQWQRWMDAFVSLADPEASRTHHRVMRWTMDEFALPAPFFRAVLEELYRQDRFCRGTLTVGGRPARPGAVTAPVFCVYDPRSRIIPPDAVLPALDLLGSAAVHTHAYGGDRGVALQHVGTLVGRNAHATLWPEVLGWLRDLPE